VYLQMDMVDKVVREDNDHILQRKSKYKSRM
jgi:hypothetical protein